jgi:hypothetical protein
VSLRFHFMMYQPAGSDDESDSNTDLSFEIDESASVSDVTKRFLAFMSAAYGYTISPEDLVQYLIDDGLIELEIVPEGE